MRLVPRRLIAVASAAALSVGLLAVSTAPTAEAAPAAKTSKAEKKRSKAVKTPKLKWYSCYGYAKCATVKVPLDYDKPKGKKVELAVLKVPAKNKKKIGTLFVNPGGPGAPGTDLAYFAPEFLSPAVTDRFDVVGFDPRGIGSSDNVRCFPTAQVDNPVFDTLFSAWFPYGAKEEKAFIKAYDKHARACSTTGKPLSGAMSTAEAARDMDLLRRAVGDKKLTYLGFSYGSYLGEVYANMYPDRVRAIAIDGIVDPVHWAGTKKTARVPMSERLRSAAGASKALRETLVRCDRAGTTKCAFAAGNPVANYEKIAQRLRKAPLVEIDPETGDEYVTTYADFVDLTLFFLYFEGGPDVIADYAAYLWQLTNPASAATKNAAVRGATVTKLIKLEKSIKDLNQPKVPGKSYGFPYDNSLDTLMTVSCTDTRTGKNLSDFSKMAAQADKKAPYFGRYWIWSQAGCSSKKWTVKDEDAYRGPFTKRTRTPVLIVGNHWDPATSYAEAVSTSKRMPNSRLLSSKSWGHTAYGTSRCVTGAVDSYLLKKKLPPKGKVCVGDYQPFTEVLELDSASRSTPTANLDPKLVGAPARPGMR